MSAKTSKQYKIVRDINKALANPHLYTDEELRTLKKKKAQFIDLKKRYNNEQFGGFGQYVR
tara:strand:+ start:606 stop:788 length:183 start_codon:yes stop_codon:yes gene_type:complete